MAGGQGGAAGLAVEIVRIPVAGAEAAARLRAAIADATRDGGYLAPPRCASVRAFAAAADGAKAGAAQPAGEPAAGSAGEVVAIVEWASRAAHDEAAAEPAAAAFIGAVGEEAAGPPSTGWYAELR